MKLMKTLILGLTLATGMVYADEQKDEKSQKPSGVEGMVKEAKSTRRKKVEMCHDCGKPEVNCDCPEELKKKEKALKAE